jgi:transposase
VTEERRWFVGVDWGSEQHVACVVDSGGHRLRTDTIAHTIEGVTAWLERILSETAASPAAIAVAIETPRGLLVETFLARGFAVFAINPKQLDRFRDRYSVAGAKDDRLDAWVLGDSLRTDGHLFRRVDPEDPMVAELREYSRLLDDVETEHRRAANRLRDQLARVVPQWLALCPGADEPWFWEVVDTGLTGEGPKRLTTLQLTRLLRRYRIRRVAAEAVQQVLAAPGFSPTAATRRAVRAHLTVLLPRLRLLRAQRQEAERQLERLLAGLATEGAAGAPREHRDITILRSLPGVGKRVAATMLAEASTALAARDYHTLRAYGGAAPVTRRSGKYYRVVSIRRACHPRLRQALYHWARVSIMLDEGARRYYRALRARGRTHARSLRSVADRWLRILTAMLTTRTLYEPARFTQAAPS